MATWQQLADDLKTDPALAGLGEEQIKAVVDVLVFTIHADEVAGFMEEAELEHQLFELPWMADKEAKVEAFVHDATERAKGATDEGPYREVVSAAAELLGDAAVRGKVYQMALTLANADMQIHPEEHKALTWLAEAFEIPEHERAAQES